MAVTKAFAQYILDCFSNSEVTCRPMMGGYLMYFRGRLFGDICDNRLLVKPVPSALALLPDAPLEPPYDGAKNMILIENPDDRELLNRLVEAMYPELPEKKPKK